MTSVNDATGALVIKGAGSTQVTTDGQEITISSAEGSGIRLITSEQKTIVVEVGADSVNLSLAPSGVNADTYGSSSVVPVITVDEFGRIVRAAEAQITGETKETVLYGPDETQATLSDGDKFLFDVGYSSVEGAASGARISSITEVSDADATALTLIAKVDDSGTGTARALIAQGDVETSGDYLIRGQNGLRLTRDPDSTSIHIGPGAGVNNSGANNVIIGRDAYPNGRFYRTIAIGDSVANNVTEIGHPTLPEGTSVLIGYNVARDAIKIGRSVAIGYKAMEQSDSIFASVAIGLFAGRRADSGTSNVFIGSLAGQSNQGAAGVVIGSGAGQSSRQFASVHIGYQAGSLVGDGDSTPTLDPMLVTTSATIPREFPEYTRYSTLIGFQTSYESDDTLTNANAIGAYAQVASSNSIVLGATTRTEGENARVGIATIAPSRFLDVNGDVRLGALGTTIDNMVRRDVDFDVPSIGAGSSFRMTVNYSGARPGSAVTVSPGAELPDGVIIQYARVPQNDRVEVKFFNASNSAQDLDNMTFSILTVE